MRSDFSSYLSQILKVNFLLVLWFIFALNLSFGWWPSFCNLLFFRFRNIYILSIWEFNVSVLRGFLWIYWDSGTIFGHEEMTEFYLLERLRFVGVTDWAFGLDLAFWRWNDVQVALLFVFDLETQFLWPHALHTVVIFFFKQFDIILKQSCRSWHGTVHFLGYLWGKYRYCFLFLYCCSSWVSFNIPLVIDLLLLVHFLWRHFHILPLLTVFRWLLSQALTVYYWGLKGLDFEVILMRLGFDAVFAENWSLGLWQDWDRF